MKTRTTTVLAATLPALGTTAGTAAADAPDIPGPPPMSTPWPYLAPEGSSSSVLLPAASHKQSGGHGTST